LNSIGAEYIPATGDRRQTATGDRPPYNPRVVPRFLVPGLDQTARVAELPEAESHHLANVMRLGVGAEVRVFDGRGHEHAARVSRLAPRRVVVELLHAVEAARESPVRIVLAQAVLKAEAMDRVVRDAVMLGAADLVPLLSARVAVPMRGSRANQLRERWGRIAVASVKQCGRATVPGVAEPVGLGSWLASLAPTPRDVPPGGGIARGAGVRLALLEPEAGDAQRPGIAGLAAEALQHGAIVAVGPEGGWTADEIAALDAHGFLRWSLGSRTLRAETAPIAALSILLYAWE
jgi:16S rRNA (uracil1498-N3)-methyltransferase